MNLKSKIHLEVQKTTAEKKLAARVAVLEQGGADAGTIKRDAAVRQGKAAVRKANYRLATIAAKEQRNADRIRVKAEKAEKAAAGANAAEAAPAEPPAEPPKKKAKKPKKAE